MAPACALVGFAALLVGLALGATGRPETAAQSTAREAARAWMTENGEELGKKIATSLMGTTIWLSKLPSKSFVPGESEPLDGDRLGVWYEIEHRKLAGRLLLTVDLRTNALYGVDRPQVERVEMVGLHAPGDPAPVIGREMVLESSPFAQGRVRYFVAGLASLLWHLLLAGIVYGALRFLGSRIGWNAEERLGLLTVSSVVIGTVAVAAFSGFAVVHLAGSAGLLMLLAAGWRMVAGRAASVG